MKSPLPWLRYLATVVLAIVFLVMSFFGGMAQRIVADMVPAGTSGIVVIASVIVLIGVMGWLIWRRQPPVKS